MSEFDTFLDAVLDGAVTLAKQTMGDVGDQAKTDVRRFLTYSRDRLKEWTTELATGSLTKREFADLVDDLPNMGELIALSDLGIAKTALQRFRDGLVELVIDAAFKAFLP